MDVGLDLAERRAEGLGDFLIVQVFEMKQHERHALVVGQRAERAFQLLAQLVLFHFEELNYQEIADALGASLGKVKTDIHRGREALKRLLPDHA